MRALAGFEIVSLAVNVPGPVVAARLSEYGASVTKIEPPGGDPLSEHFPRWYRRLTDEQTILRLDLKSREGKSALGAQLKSADLLITSTRPRARARLGLDTRSLRDRYPRLCQLEIVGFPSPDEEIPGHDLSFQAAAGLLGDPPTMPITLLADLMGAERAATEAVAMLLHRKLTREATCRRVSLADAAKRLAVPIELGVCAPEGPLGGAHCGYGLYRSKDGWIALAALEPAFLARLAAGLRIPSVSHARLRRVFRTRTSARWEAWGRRYDVPITGVRGVAPVTKPRRIGR